MKQMKEKNQDKKIGYKDLLKQKQYSKLLTANLVNCFGDSIDAIAFTWLVYTVTKNPAWSAIIFGINFIPTIFLQPFTGALVENWNKKKVMAICDIARGIGVGIIFLLYITNNLDPYSILIFTIANSTFEAFRVPAGMAIMPQVLDKKYYDFATSFNSSSSRIMELVGTGLAGGIIGLLGIEAAMLLDIVTFILSAVLIMWIQLKEDKKEKVELNVKAYWELLKGGAQYMIRNKLLFELCIICLLLNGALVPLNSLMTPYISEVLKQDAYFLSLFSMFLTIGMIIGAFIYPYIAKRIKGKSFILFSGVSLGVFYIVLAGGKLLVDKVIVLGFYICIATFILGLLIAISITLLQVYFITSVEESYLARAGAIFGACATAGVPILSAITAALSKLASLNTIFIGTAIVTILLFLILGVKSVGFDAANKTEMYHTNT